MVVWGRAFWLLLAVAGLAFEGRAETLALNLPLERTLASGQRDQFQVEAAANDYVRVAVEGRGALLRVAVADSQNHVVAERSRTGGNRDPITWAAVAEGPTSYRFEVYSQEPAGVSRTYTITLTNRRSAGPLDRLAAEAEAALGEAGFERSIQLAHDAHDVRLEAEACYQAAQADFAAGRPRDAISRFEQAQAIWHAQHDSYNEGRALRALGKVYGDTQQAAKAIECLEKGLALADAAGDSAGQAEALRELGSVAGSRGDFPKAREFFDRGLPLARRAGDRRTEADILNMLGVLDQSAGQDAGTLANYEAALALRKAIGDRAGVAQSTNNLGAYHRNRGEARTAIRYYEESLSMRRQLGNPVGIGNALENLAVANGDLGNFEKSVDLALEAAELFRSSQAHRGEMFALTSLGDTYSRMGDLDKALVFYARAREIARKTADRRGEALAMLSTGSIHAARKQFDDAVRDYSESLRIGREANLPRELTLTLLAHAEVELQKGDARAALASAREALDLSHKHGYRREEGRALSFLGGAMLATDPSQAKEMLTQALAIQKEIADPDQEAITRSRLAKYAQQTGDLGAARDHAFAALALLESERQNAPPEGPRISFQASKHLFYQQAVDILMAMHLDREAFDISERFRARALLDQLAGSKDLYRKADPQILPAGEIQERVLDAGSVLLEYMLGPERSYVWVVSRDAFRSYALPSREAIERLVQDAQGPLLEPGRLVADETAESRQKRMAGAQREFERSAAELARALLPAGFDRSVRHVLIAPDGPLYSIPFSTLLPVAAEPVMLPSASSLAYLRRKRDSSGIAIFADPVYPIGSARLARLRLTRE